MTIKHIVISGGLIYGFCFYGVLKHLHQQHYWNLDNIETFYGTSIGALFSTILALDFDWDTLDNYIINRPWQTVFTLNIHSFINCFQNVGIFDISIIREVFLPLFEAKDISIDITMNDFYEITKKELHFFTIQLDTFELVEISYKTHPTWTVLESVYASCCAPFLFAPLVKNNTVFVDGGMFANYPMKQCMDSIATARTQETSILNPNEILGICICKKSNPIASIETYQTMNLYSFMNVLIQKIMFKMTDTVEDITNTIKMKSIDHIVAIHDVYTVSTSPDIRKQLIEYGMDHAKVFLLEQLFIPKPTKDDI
jgi:predicted acylesterase/phospholipase RssA